MPDLRDRRNQLMLFLTLSILILSGICIVLAGRSKSPQSGGSSDQSTSAETGSQTEYSPSDGSGSAPEGQAGGESQSGDTEKSAEQQTQVQEQPGSSGANSSGGTGGGTSSDTSSGSWPNAAVCGTAGYNGNGSVLPTFQSKYPADWRSDYSFADIWNRTGAVYENFKLPTSIFIKSDNAVIRNFYINPGSDYYVVRTDGREMGAGTTIINGTIAGSGATDNSLYKGIVADVNNMTISDMDISGTHDGIGISSQNVSVSNVCIHDLGTAPNAHNDGIEIYGGSNITIKNSQIINNKTQTSAINITNDYGAISDVLIENVRLSGGGYTIYVRGDGMSGGAITNIRFRNVVIENPGHWGVISYQGASGAITEWDVKDANGNAVPHP